MILPAALPQPAGQRQRGHRGRYGHQHPAAQPARGGGGRAVAPRPPRGFARGVARRAHRAHSGPRLPHGRDHPWPPRHRGGVPHRSRLDHDARRGQHRGGPGPHVPGHHRAAVPGQPRQPRDQDRRPRQGRQGRRYRRHSRPVVGPHRASASRSCSSATPSPRWCSTTSTSTRSCRTPSAATCSRSWTACRAPCRSTASCATG